MTNTTSEVIGSDATVVASPISENVILTSKDVQFDSITSKCTSDDDKVAISKLQSGGLFGSKFRFVAKKLINADDTVGSNGTTASISSLVPPFLGFVRKHEKLYANEIGQLHIMLREAKGFFESVDNSLDIVEELLESTDSNSNSNSNSDDTKLKESIKRIKQLRNNLSQCDWLFDTSLVANKLEDKYGTVNNPAKVISNNRMVSSYDEVIESMPEPVTEDEIKIKSIVTNLTSNLSYQSKLSGGWKDVLYRMDGTIDMGIALNLWKDNEKIEILTEMLNHVKKENNTLKSKQKEDKFIHQASIDSLNEIIRNLTEQNCQSLSRASSPSSALCKMNVRSSTFCSPPSEAANNTHIQHDIQALTGEVLSAIQLLNELSITSSNSNDDNTNNNTHAPPTDNMQSVANNINTNELSSTRIGDVNKSKSTTLSKQSRSLSVKYQVLPGTATIDGSGTSPISFSSKLKLVNPNMRPSSDSSSSRPTTPHVWKKLEMLKRRQVALQQSGDRPSLHLPSISADASHHDSATTASTTDTTVKSATVGIQLSKSMKLEADMTQDISCDRLASQLHAACDNIRRRVLFQPQLNEEVISSITNSNSSSVDGAALPTSDILQRAHVINRQIITHIDEVRRLEALLKKLTYAVTSKPTNATSTLKKRLLE